MTQNKKSKAGRFSALRDLRERRDEHELQEAIEIEQEQEEGASTAIAADEATAPSSSSVEALTKREPLSVKESREETTYAETSPEPKKRGRPPGRRSDPDYTQISAYIPLDLLLAVQDELAQERREKRRRTARPVSDLVEDLLSEWLKTRNTEKLKS